MPTQQTPLEVESYYVRELHFRTNSDFDDEQPESGELDVDFDVQRHPDDPSRFQVGMSIAVGSADTLPANEPYSLHLLINGYFRFKEGTTEEIRLKMMFSNAVPILYGIARGCVGQVTGVGFHGPLMLQPYNFVAHMERKAALHKEESEFTPRGQLDAPGDVDET